MKIYLMFAIIGWAWALIFAIIAMFVWTWKSKRASSKSTHEEQH